MEENKKQLQNFAYNIAAIRNHYGISKKRMAKLLRIGTVSLNRMERGDVSGKMSVEVLANAARQFRYRPAELLNQKLKPGKFLEGRSAAGEAPDRS